MNPNGKYWLLRAVLVMACTTGLFCVPGNAAITRGNFKLTAEARWGRIVLTPGDYEFTFDPDAPGRMVTVRSLDAGWSAIIMSSSISDSAGKLGSALEVVRSENARYVRALDLHDLGMVLNFEVPKARSGTRLVKSPAKTTVASASATH